MLKIIPNCLLRQEQNVILLRFSITKNAIRKSSNASIKNANVAGLSDKCVKMPTTSVGPGAAKDKEYKNPEYFCYHVDSFGEAEVELAKYRLPPPSNKVPFQR